MRKMWVLGLLMLAGCGDETSRLKPGAAAIVVSPEAGRGYVAVRHGPMGGMIEAGAKVMVIEDDESPADGRRPVTVQARASDLRMAEWVDGSDAWAKIPRACLRAD